MATIVKLRREGTRHKPFWRIVVTDSRKPKDCIEQLGTYDTLHKPAKLVLNADKAVRWVLLGATPSVTVRSIFKKNGILKKAAEQKKMEVKRETAG
jgi:small subunit ribosomal protein S16